MNIAFFHELSFGGAWRTVDEYGKRLKKKHKVDLYTVTQNNQTIVLEKFHQVFLYPFHPKEWSKGNWKVRVYKDTIELLQLNLLHRQIAKEINKKDYDLVFVHPSQYTQAPFLLKYLLLPSIYYCQEPLRIVYDEYINRLEDLSLSRRVYETFNRWIRKKIDATNISHAQVILANSKFSQEKIQKAYNREAYLCYLGVNSKKFKPLRVKKVYDILFVGQKEEIEGYDLLSSALQYFKCKPVIKIISRQPDGRGITDNDLLIEYNKAKIVVALSRNEPFGLFPLEAMACGVPVIAVNEGGFRESIIDKETGFLIERNSKELCKIITKLLNNTELSTIIRLKAREHVVRNWSWDRSVSRLYTIIEQCIHKK